MERDMSVSLVGVVGRGLLALLFILAGVTKIISKGPVVDHMRQAGVPIALLPVVAAFELAAGSALLMGWRTAWAAGALGVFCLLTALVFHRNFQVRAERTSFMKDIALAGALLFVAAAALS
jgi:putative oxidoreductase